MLAKEQWLSHLRDAYSKGDLTLQEYERDVQDVLYGMRPRNLLRLMEDHEPVYGDSVVPYAWLSHERPH